MARNIAQDRHALLGLILLGAGVILLTTQVFGGTARYLWPFFIIVPGAAAVAVGLAAGGRARALAVPGTTLAGIGLILLVQNTLNHYESWAYAWALVPVFVGTGLILTGDDDATARSETQAGRHLATWGTVAFLIMATLFEGFIFDGGMVGIRYAVPVVLILAGGAVLAGWTMHSGPTAQTDDDTTAEADRTA